MELTAHARHRTYYKYNHIKHSYMKTHYTVTPHLCRDFSKYKFMKNLARTLSLFLIFCRNFYKSKIKNIVTKCLSNKPRIKVLTVFAGQKLSINAEYISY